MVKYELGAGLGDSVNGPIVEGANDPPASDQEEVVAVYEFGEAKNAVGFAEETAVEGFTDFSPLLIFCSKVVKSHFDGVRLWGL